MFVSVSGAAIKVKTDGCLLGAHVCKYKDFMVATGEAVTGQTAYHEAKYVSLRSVGREVQLREG